MVRLFLLLFLSICLYAKDFTVSSYNVENLFDLELNKTDYKEYKPNTNSNWNKKTFNIKLSNTIKVLKDLDSDIIALQEIENKELIKLLLKILPEYKYYSFSKYPNASVGVGFLSKIKIIKNKTINVKFSNKIFRPILETTFKLDDFQFKIFNNHWPSKRSPESYRIKYAKKLFDRINELPEGYDYILLGDFNSNYNEFETIYYNKELNNTQSLTGINQVLNTTIDKNYITKEDILKYKKRVHYNLWLELAFEGRFSSKYRGENQTPDNILVSASLFDNKNISFKINSFKVFKPSYLYKNKKINRWQTVNKKHKGYGFSDHLPISASFTTAKVIKKESTNKKIKHISQLYEKIKLTESIDLKDIIVIYKNANNAIIKQKNDRAIYLFNNAQGLIEGNFYNIKVFQIKNYFGLKEIKDFKIVKNNGKFLDYENLYLDLNKLNIDDLKYQNEIVKDIEGLYKNGNFYYKDKVINIYFRNKEDKPNNTMNIKIKRAQIGYYKDKIQLVIHKKSDFDVN
ncbi:endonuclease/exonuclease/phosphatase family protein [Halarcobacter sp.]|uniref:endonuclease/exonuclease/phosphatase family protein n=1 Tax=Halarcobacter sp. TaxID=2321133 RepID=UPI0029F588D4|nr:endonuclease/exonuclease/phosphatase family protein [Halarcobacter sp.]